MTKKILQYGKVRLLDVAAEKPEELSGLDETNVTNIRVELPADAGAAVLMQRRGYILGDRTLGVSINLQRSDVDYKALARFDVRESEDYPDEILRLALDSFPADRRFHIRPELDDLLAAKVITTWVREMKAAPFVCVHKGELAGFLYLDETEDGAFIRLAAVAERYRSSGVAVSLYAHVVDVAKERGCKKVEGRVSSANTAVMNLYAFLGAAFRAPRDVWLKELSSE